MAPSEMLAQPQSAPTMRALPYRPDFSAWEIAGQPDE